MRRIVALAIAGALLITATEVHAKRLALVIGIDAYDNLGPGAQLKKAVGDARTIAATLKELDFAVAMVENPRRAELFGAWQRFIDNVAPGDDAVVYFAGHGIEISRDNYLVPRDAPVVESGEQVFRSGAVRLVELLDSLDQRKARTVLVVLDACRNNPFSATGRSIGLSRGLGRTEPPRGTMILYSAGVGQVALDAVPGRPEIANSVFTHVLAPLLKTPGLDLVRLIKMVQQQVYTLTEASGHRQLPAYYDQTLADVVLAGAGPPAAMSQPPPPLPAAESTNAPFHECDRLAADPYDPEAVAPGVAGPNMKDAGQTNYAISPAALAVEMCEEAVRRHPNVRRFSYQRARALDAKGDFAPALETFKTLAGINHGPAMYSLAVAHYWGRGVPKNNEYGLYWLKRAVEAGNADAMFILGQYTANAVGGVWPGDPGRAVFYWRRAVELGHSTATVSLAGAYDRGEGGLTRDPVTASFWMMKALRAGDGLAFWLMTTGNLSPDFYKAMKQRLAELDCYNGPIEERNSPALQSAVLALKHSCK